MGGFKHTMVCQFCEDRLKKTNIHSVWDADMFDHELREAFEYDYVDQMENFELDRYPFAQKLYSMVKERHDRLRETNPEQLEGWTEQCSGDFGRCIDTAVGETRKFYVDNEKELYAGEKDGVVTKAYLDKYLEKAFEQVIKASVRLAAALNKMAKDLSETKGEKQRDEPAPTSPPPKMRASRSPAREREDDLTSLNFLIGPRVLTKHTNGSAARLVKALLVVLEVAVASVVVTVVVAGIRALLGTRILRDNGYANEDVNALARKGNKRGNALITFKTRG
ncbi:hypothetical protein FOZ63_030609 [Perkinsus olseni]|uniref:Uncharacterized protein n=1 Tax=Perkinsus olseni TaxID=32597 RepID=A0A7J6Q2R2_PEROL|nr:hypothetical protein FOZ63_030609 [Perkinsus olseni]